jgi:cytochrome c
VINKINQQGRLIKVPLALLSLGIALAVVASRVDAQGAQDGKALFDKRCAGCHSLDSDHEGPRLRGVVGRTAGSVKTFKYSASLQSAGFAWDAAKLDKWLTDTESLVPDNDMSFRVQKQDERAAIIAWLTSLTSQ